jgi:hypothetical protein
MFEWSIFNTRILDTTMNYTNQDYVHVNYTLIVSMLLVTGSQSKNMSCFCMDGPIAIADWSIIVQCHLLVKHGF